VYVVGCGDDSGVRGRSPKPEAPEPGTPAASANSTVAAATAKARAGRGCAVLFILHLRLRDEALVLVVDGRDCRIRVRVVEDVESRGALRMNLQVGAAPLVANANGQLVGCRLPKQRDLETVTLAMCKLSRLVLNGQWCDCHVVAPRIDLVVVEKRIATTTRRVSVGSCQAWIRLAGRLAVPAS